MALKTTRWDAADYLKTVDDIAAYLDVALEDGDPELLRLVLGDIARAKGMTGIAKAAGLGRQNLYKALSPDGNPEFATVVGVLKALGLRLSVTQERVRKRRVTVRAGTARSGKGAKPAKGSVAGGPKGGSTGRGKATPATYFHAATGIDGRKTRRAAPAKRSPKRGKPT
jgi:probable addiction module antidote protein